MFITIHSPNGPDIEIDIHPNGQCSVRANAKFVGRGTWIKAEDMLILDLPDESFPAHDTGTQLVFNLKPG